MKKGLFETDKDKDHKIVENGDDLEEQKVPHSQTGDSNFPKNLSNN